MLRGARVQTLQTPLRIFSTPPVPDVKQAHFTGMAQWLARGAHNSEVTRSKRVAGIFHTSHRCIKALEHLIASAHQGTGAPYHRLSLTEERRAHNPEVTGSTPVGGILRIRVLYRSAHPLHDEGRQAGRKTEHSQSRNSGVAQRQSIYNIVGRILRPCIKVRKTDGYRLISGRSQDRNLSPEYLIHVLYRSA